MSVEIPRDNWGRPLIIPPNGGQPVPYTRASTMAKTLDDMGPLGNWFKRQMVKGFAAMPQLLGDAIAAGDTYWKLTAIAEKAMEAAKSMEAAEIGTLLHTITEELDTNGVATTPHSAEFTMDLMAYERATARMKAMQMEQFVVIDELQTAGSFDRIWASDYGITIGDLKTGKATNKYSHSTQIQLALYAHGQAYDPVTGERSPLPEGLRQDLGLLVHMPIRTGTCAIYELDLEEGWERAKQAFDVRAWRKTKPATPSRFYPPVKIGGAK